MIPKEKAIELTTAMMLNQFMPNKTNGITEKQCHENAKQCAMIALELLIEEFIDVYGDDLIDNIEYWNQIKLEIKKL